MMRPSDGQGPAKDEDTPERTGPDPRMLAAVGVGAAVVVTALVVWRRRRRRR
jgi:hypothetical protein